MRLERSDSDEEEMDGDFSVELYGPVRHIRVAEH